MMSKLYAVVSDLAPNSFEAEVPGICSLRLSPSCRLSQHADERHSSYSDTSRPSLVRGLAIASSHHRTTTACYLEGNGLAVFLAFEGCTWVT